MTSILEKILTAFLTDLQKEEEDELHLSLISVRHKPSYCDHTAVYLCFWLIIIFNYRTQTSSASKVQEKWQSSSQAWRQIVNGSQLHPKTTAKHS